MGLTMSRNSAVAAPRRSRPERRRRIPARKPAVDELANVPRKLPIRRLVVACSGGIGAALLPAWGAWLRATYGLELRFALTRAAAELVSPRALSAIAGAPTIVDGRDRGAIPAHLRLARFGEALVIAPATANLAAKLACGIADDLVSTLALCFVGPTVVVPGLPPGAIGKPSVQRNLARLRRDGFHVAPLAVGPSAASGEDGLGAMLDLPAFVRFLASACGDASDRVGEPR